MRLLRALEGNKFAPETTGLKLDSEGTTTAVNWIGYGLIIGRFPVAILLDRKELNWYHHYAIDGSDRFGVERFAVMDFIWRFLSGALCSYDIPVRPG